MLSHRESDSLLHYSKIGAQVSSLTSVPVPSKFIGKTFGDLYYYLAVCKQTVALGVYRPVDAELENVLPFVYTNPLPTMILLEGELVYVLKPSHIEIN